MATSGPVHWHEGLFLQPHHLQWMQRHALDLQVSERRLGMAYPYGLIEARVSSDALENMLVRFDRLRAVMPSGLMIDYPGNTEIPPLDVKKVIEGSSQALQVKLGVPLWYESRANTIELGSGDDWRVKRMFRVSEVQRSDENTGENPQPVLVRKINARLLLDGDDQTDLEVLPLVRIVRSTGSEAGLPRVDASYVPPCLVLTGWTALRDLVRDVAAQVDARRKEVVVQLTRGGFSIEMVRGLQLEQMLRLRTLNNYAARLPTLALAPNVTPLEMYLELRGLLGELAGLRPDRDLFDAARYDHDNPGPAFVDVIGKIRRLLGEQVQRTYLEAKFAPEEEILSLTLTQEHMTIPNDYFLGIRSKEDSRAIAKLVENANEFKFMPWSMRGRVVYGVRLAEERHPPAELPAQTGLHYFRLMRAESVRSWEQIKSEGKVALRWPEMASSDYQVTLYMTVPSSEG